MSDLQTLLRDISSDVDSVNHGWEVFTKLDRHQPSANQRAYRDLAAVVKNNMNLREIVFRHLRCAVSLQFPILTSEQAHFLSLTEFRSRLADCDLAITNLDSHLIAVGELGFEALNYFRSMFADISSGLFNSWVNLATYYDAANSELPYPRRQVVQPRTSTVGSSRTFMVPASRVEDLSGDLGNSGARWEDQDFEGELSFELD